MNLAALFDLPKPVRNARRVVFDPDENALQRERDKNRAYSAAFRRRYPGLAAERATAWNRAHPERRAAILLAYQRRNIERVRANKRNYMRRLRQRAQA